MLRIYCLNYSIFIMQKLKGAISGLLKRLSGHIPVIKIGLLTGLTIVGFQIINLFVVYRQIKLDYYLSLVAVVFLLAGIWLSPRQKAAATPALPARQSTAQLTVKEMEVLALIAAGAANKQIAAQLFVELSTVKTHINNIYGKLSVTNRRDAAAKYAQMAGSRQ
jgi:DNA-binding CsgD family transcriptional regulator